MNHQVNHRRKFPFCLTHSARFQTAVRLLNPRSGQRILDYGCGDGHLMNLLSPAEVVGYDPSPSDNPNILNHIPSGPFDAIAVCEVLEHVTLNEARQILLRCRRLLKPEGRLVVSVPLEVGPSSLLKNVIRAAVVRPLETNITVGNVLKVACYSPIERLDYGQGSYGHMGFDYHEVEILIRQLFTVKARIYSPVPMFKGLLNSQVFYACGSV